MSVAAILPLLITITLISLSVYYFFSRNGAPAEASSSNSRKAAAIVTETTNTTVIGDDDEATADQEKRNFGIGDGEELIEGTVTLGVTKEEEEEEEEKEARKAKERKKLFQQKEDSAKANGFDLGGLLGETMEKIKMKNKKENENVLTNNTEVVDDEKKDDDDEKKDDDDEKKEEDDDTKTKDRNKDVISYYHQAATNRKPGVEIHHIVLLHGQRFTKENWKTSGILSMFNRQFPSIAVTACNLTTELEGDDINNNHYLLLDLLDKLEAKGVISLPLSGLVTPSASGKTITDWLCEQIVDDDDDSTVASVDEDEEEDDKKDDKKVETEETEADEKEEVDDDKDDEAVEEEEEDTAAKDEDEENDKKVDDDDDNNNNDAGKGNENENEDNTQKKKKIKIPLDKLLQYVRRWIPVASYSVMNCTKNQLRLLGAFTVCGEGEGDDNDNSNESDDEKKLNKRFNILAIYGYQDQGGSIVSKRLEKYSYAKVKELNGTHPVYLDSPDEFVPAIGWAIIL